jgi:hypothetical protein
LEVLRGKHPETRVPDLANPQCSSFEAYPETPEVLPLDFSPEDVERVASKLAGAAGPLGADAVETRNWLLRFGEESIELREEIASWADWLANSSPSWAAYRALMACRLVALDKQPGVRPVGIGEILRRLIAKMVVRAAGDQAKAACGNRQLCAGLEAGIEGAVHAVRRRRAERRAGQDADAAEEAEVDDDATVSDDNSVVVEPLPDGDGEAAGDGMEAETQEPGLLPLIPEELAGVPGTLLLDAFNGFQELRRIAMLWTVRHRWAAGARFAFNCYRHYAKLVIRRPAKPPHVLLSREGVTQGDPLSMLLYGVALVPLVEELRQADPMVMSPFYADDAVLDGGTRRLARLLRFLMEKGPEWGYYPEPEKSIFVADCPSQMDAARAAFEAEGLTLRYEAGHRYVGGFVGPTESRDEWLEPKVAEWAAAVRTLANFAPRYPQAAYAGMAMSLQAEWQYLQRTVPGAGEKMGPIEEALKEHFLPALFGGKVDADLRELVGHSVRNGGLGLPDPTLTAARNHETSVSCCVELTDSLLEGIELDCAEHYKCCRASSESARLRKEAEQQKALMARMAAANPLLRGWLDRSQLAGAWITAVPNRLNGMELSEEQFHDNLRLRYGLLPLGLPDRCDGCGATMTVEHALTCKRGGLVMIRHDNTTKEFGELAARALTPSAVSYEPLINSRTATGGRRSGSDGGRGGKGLGGETEWGTTAGGSGNGGGQTPRGTPARRTDGTARRETGTGTGGGIVDGGGDIMEAWAETRGDLAVDSFWKRAHTTIMDVRVTFLEAPSHRGRAPDAVLRQMEKEKKDKHLAACLARRRHFTPLVYSSDSVPGAEAKAAERRLASLLANKLKREYPEMCGFVRARMAMAVVRSNSLLLRGARDHEARIWSRPEMEDGAALSLMRPWRD